MGNSQLTPETMMSKAETACASARILLEHGDTDGATNRAYYAMFDAARAALLASGAPVDLETIRSHSGLIGAFGNFLVKNGPVSKDIGRLLSRTLNVRFMADYAGISVEPSVAKDIVVQAETFIAALRIEFMPDNNVNDDDELGS